MVERQGIGNAAGAIRVSNYPATLTVHTLEHSDGAATSAHDPEMDALVEAMQAALSPAEAEAQFLKIYRMIYDKYIHLPVANLDVSYAGSDRIHRDWNRAWRSWEPNYLDLVRRR